MVFYYVISIYNDSQWLSSQRINREFVRFFEITLEELVENDGDVNMLGDLTGKQVPPKSIWIKFAKPPEYIILITICIEK